MLTATTTIAELHCLAAWASARAARPRPGDIIAPSDLRTFARECRERARRLEVA